LRVLPWEFYTADLVQKARLKGLPGGYVNTDTQGSHASWKVLESPGFFFWKIPGPGKSWKITLVLENPEN